MLQLQPMSRDLSWSNHIDASVNKANKVLGLLKRTVGSKNRDIFSVLCRSLVRPLLEYASPVWSPYPVKNKLAIESVQRRASRIALGQKRREMTYEERCELITRLELLGMLFPFNSKILVVSNNFVNCK